MPASRPSGQSFRPRSASASLLWLSWEELRMDMASVHKKSRSDGQAQTEMEYREWTHAQEAELSDLF